LNARLGTTQSRAFSCVTDATQPDESQDYRLLKRAALLRIEYLSASNGTFSLSVRELSPVVSPSETSTSEQGMLRSDVKLSSIFTVRPEALQTPRKARDVLPVILPYLRSTRFQGSRWIPPQYTLHFQRRQRTAAVFNAMLSSEKKPVGYFPKDAGCYWLPTVEQKRQLFLGPLAKSREFMLIRHRFVKKDDESSFQFPTCSLVQEY
jgi:hypothetical protein